MRRGAMLQPLRPGQRNRQISRASSAPPPVGGWNRRDALDMMRPGDAIILDNWFPRESDVVSRRGYTSHCNSGSGATVDYLFEHFSGTTQKLLAFSGGDVWDVSTSTPSKTYDASLSGGWVGCMFNGKSFFANGTDSALDFDGSSTWTATAWTGSGLASTADLNYVFAFKSRLYFVEKNSQSFWYGGTNSVTGTLTEFPLQGVGNFGGNLLAVHSITHDGGEGLDDYFCAFMSSGEVIVYRGTGDPASFVLVGVYHIGPLVNKRALTRVGAELLAITSDGYIPVTKVLRNARSSPKQAISDKITQEASYVVKQHGSNSGWQAIVYHKGPYVLINVPVSASSIQQHVMNLNTGAWCRFTGQAATCWAIFADNLYFGNASGVVYKADNGFSDAGTAISTDAQTAWNYFGDRGRLKKFNAIRPIFVADGDPGAQYGTGVDFETIVPTSALAVPSTTASYTWDDPASIWDVATWGGAYRSARGWQTTAGGIGYCASLRVRTSNTAKDVQFQAINVLYEPGGLM